MAWKAHQCWSLALQPLDPSGVKPVGERIQALNKDPAQLFPNTDAGKEELDWNQFSVRPEGKPQR